MDPVDELETIRQHSADAIADALLSYARAMVAGRDEGRAQQALYRLLAQTMILSDLLGRRRTLLLTRSAEAGAKASGAIVPPDMAHGFCAARGHATSGEPVRLTFADAKPKGNVPTDPVVPHVVFEQAVRDILAREPVLAPGYLAVQDAYARGYVFAVAKSTEAHLTERLQKAVADALASGADLAKSSKIIEDIGPWTRAYADNVYRTNLATAYSGGMIAQARTPNIARVMLAYELSGVNDSAARASHKAAWGLIADTTDPVWQRFTPPLGYQCRCSLSLVSRFELEERGLLSGQTVRRYEPASFATASPDPGFGSQGALLAAAGTR